MTVIDSDILDFVGEPFDLGLVLPQAAPPAPTPVPSPVAAPPGGEPVRDLRAALARAHASAMRAQTGLLRLAMTPAASRPAPAAPRPEAPQLPSGPSVDDDLPARRSSVREFKPLARSVRTDLSAADLARLAAGEIHAVFGRPEDLSYDQRGANPDIVLTEAEDGLVAVTELDATGGRWGEGRLVARCEIATQDGFRTSGRQAAEVLAMLVGLHLCLPDARFEIGGTPRVTGAPEPGEYLLEAEVYGATLVPRPGLSVTARLIADGETVAQLAGLELTVRERAGMVIGPTEGGVFTGTPARRTRGGEPVLLNEFHMAHASVGDLGVIMGPEFTRFLHRRATRMPDGGLRLCDRMLEIEGTRGRLDRGAAVSEYDSPANSWYYREYASDTMPNAILMETSLQSALMMGYFMGPTLTDPDCDYCLRNLDGRAILLRPVDLRDKTIRQRSELLETTVNAEAILQSFSYELSVDGAPFYRGTSLFGFFTEAAMANQTGLDGGRSVPTWLDQHPAATVRTVDITARRPGHQGPGPSRGHLALLRDFEVVDGGGQYGEGYVRAVRPVHEDDWFFGLHFHLDPVMPGSLGVEATVQALQEWAVDAGLFAELTDPEFVIPTGIEFAWTYRGQILARDGAMTLEAHIKRIERGDGWVRVVADASVFKPGLRIYGMTDLAIEAREKS